MVLRHWQLFYVQASINMIDITRGSSFERKIVFLANSTVAKDSRRREVELEYFIVRKDNWWMDCHGQIANRCQSWH